ncbi:DUF1360 domain-containing protein [Calidifontibacillus erzurumensis]|uniref:DUF1360 domain-containing protein n=1 Tax=Calidifontibacillus erzurumensis TaxID=2741433 RepID=A0A8J8K8R8_9BACI|nr:DUF1360 domain-containing protein [Calidifontibacillus erzurumensis]NSL52251.1 DUF1360 domain-containing protein [Calidifontibacillus erzurumensis]
MKKISWMTYIMLILASYRLTHLIVFDKITEFIRDPFMTVVYKKDAHGHTYRKKVPKNNFGYLLNCYWCSGVWSALLIGMAYLLKPKLTQRFIFILSLAGAQSIIETFVGVGTKTIHYLSSLEQNAQTEKMDSQ